MTKSALPLVMVVGLLDASSSLAACRCYQSDGPRESYVNLTPVSCTSTPQGYSWLPVSPGSQAPSSPLFIAFPSSWTYTGCSFLNYEGEVGGLPHVLLGTAFGGTCSQNPPALIPDQTPPDSNRPTTCPTQMSSFWVNGTDQSSCSKATYWADTNAHSWSTGACPNSSLCYLAFVPNGNGCTMEGPPSYRYYQASELVNYKCYNTINYCR